MLEIANRAGPGLSFILDQGAGRIEDESEGGG